MTQSHHGLFEPESDVTVENIEGCIRITLNRPAKLNALTTPMKGQLMAALDWAEKATGAYAIVLSGAGRAFCAGADTTELRPDDSHGFTESLARVELTQRIINRLRSSHLIIISAVNGVAVGGGIAFALGADIVCASEEATFNLVFGKRGLVPDAGLTEILTDALGHRKALSLALTCAEMSATEAHQMGLVDHLFGPGELEHGVERVLEGLCKVPPDVALLTKRLFSRPGERGDTVEALAQATALSRQANSEFTDTTRRTR